MPNCISKPSAVCPNGQAITPALFISTSIGRPDATVPVRERTNGRKVGEIDGVEREIGVGHLGSDALGGLGVLLRVSGEHEDRRAVSGERTGRLLSQAARGAGDHETTTGQVDAVEHVVGG